MTGSRDGASGTGGAQGGSGGGLADGGGLDAMGGRGGAGTADGSGAGGIGGSTMLDGPTADTPSGVDGAVDAASLHCQNGTRDVDETDVDCGGASCAPCAEGKACALARDCAAGNQCAATRCTTKAPPLDSALVGYWPFDNGPADASGMKNDATAFNAAATPAGKVGGAYQLTGNGCLLVAHSASLTMVGGNTFTLMAWVNYAGACAAGLDRAIIINQEDSYEMGVQCGTVPALQEAIEVLGSTAFPWMGTKTVTINAWHHVAVVWDGSMVVHYVNGAPYDGHTVSGQLSDKSSGLGIGCRTVPPDGSSTGVNSFFIGSIDEAAIYSRALSAAEILAYYNATK
jgi:hypothetical protein